jgi:phosphatidylglycerol:prolipoprotein diacylglycerol transferase
MWPDFLKDLDYVIPRIVGLGIIIWTVMSKMVNAKEAKEAKEGEEATPAVVKEQKTFELLLIALGVILMFGASFIFPDPDPDSVPWKPRTFGVVIMLGTCLAIWLAAKRGEKFGFDKDRVWDFGIYMVLAGILGARFFDVWEKWDSDFWPNFAGPDAEWGLGKLIWKCFAIWEGGLTFYGGFMVSAIVGILLLKKWQYPIGKFADVIVPSIALGHAFGRLACFLQGCCYGGKCEADFPLGVTFPDAAMVYRNADQYVAPPIGTPVHPTQLYESGVELLLFFFLSWLLFRKHTVGVLMFIWMILYGVARYAIEEIRVDNKDRVLLGFNMHFSQYVAIFMIFAGVVGWWTLKVREKHTALK